MRAYPHRTLQARVISCDSTFKWCPLPALMEPVEPCEHAGSEMLANRLPALRSRAKITHGAIEPRRLRDRWTSS